MGETKRQLLLIVNPVSGTSSKAGMAEHIEERLSRAGFDIHTEYTTCAGDATRLARRAVEQGCYGVLACGGDGTVNETARALCDTPVALGIVPTGSGNGLARHIEIPVDVDGSLDIIMAERASATQVSFFILFSILVLQCYLLLFFLPAGTPDGWAFCAGRESTKTLFTAFR